MPTRRGGFVGNATTTPVAPGSWSLLVLDSTVLIDFLRGRPAVQRVLALRGGGEVPATTAMTGNPKDFPMSELRVEHWPVGS